MKVRIKRQDDRRSAPYWQVFHFRGEGRITVAAILEKLNERDQLEDIKGKQCRKIRWECGCMQKMCGGCAMVINGHPALACGVFINTDDTEILRLEPLTKFPVVEDLIVDRSVIWERPNYIGAKDDFYGAEFANNAYLLHSSSLNRKRALEKQYEEHFAKQCSKSLACRDICPAHLQTLSSISYMNRR